MARDRILNFYLSARKREMVAAGQGIYGRIGQAVLAEGWALKLRDTGEAVAGPGYHLIYNSAVLEPHCLVLRRCYMEPFYRIETSNYRWEWEVANLPFTPSAGAEWFLKHWQGRIFRGEAIAQKGYIFMPLQGKLLECRYFQELSPIDMIAATLAADPTRQIFATLHPKETYSDAEMTALQRIGGRFEVVDRPSLPLLAGCDYVVTENSAMALSGFFARKPAVLFAEMDFHHIAGSVPRQGVEQAFCAVGQAQPFARYLHWFFKEQAISALADDSAKQIVNRLRRHGWPI